MQKRTLFKIHHSLTLLTLKRLLLTVSMGCFVATANADPLDDADAAYKRGDYAQALKIWRPLAAEGNSFSQIALGFMYVHGLGVMRNYQEAVKWYRLAAAQGSADAQYRLGLAHFIGRGVSIDYQKTLKWYRLAAAQGDVDAQSGLGVMYDQGIGVTQDFAEAVKWWRLAAAQGNVIAQFNLGVMHHRGTGVSKNDELAYFWWLLSSESGDQDSINSLSYLEKKLTLEQRENAIAAAAKWSPVRTLHFLRNVDAGAKNRDIIAKRMTPQQIEKAQDMARACQARNFKGC